MKPVLVDTSVWRRFFAGATTFHHLANLLDEDGAVAVHSFVIGELTMGGLSEREQILFDRLPTLALVPHPEVLDLVRRQRLTRRGLGWIDAHLLASVLAGSAQLWSADKALTAAADRLSVAFHPRGD